GIEQGQVLPQGERLKRAPDPGARDPMRRPADDRPPLETDIPLGRCIDPGNGVEHRGFPGAVWSDDAEHRPRQHGETHPVDGHEAAESLRQLQDLQDRVGCWTPLSPGVGRAWSARARSRPSPTPEVPNNANAEALWTEVHNHDEEEPEGEHPVEREDTEDLRQSDECDRRDE